MKANRAHEFEGVLGTFLPVCIIAVALRSYCRHVLVKSFGLDDWFAVLAIVNKPLFICIPFQLHYANQRQVFLYILQCFCYDGNSLWDWTYAESHSKRGFSGGDEGMLNLLRIGFLPADLWNSGGGHVNRHTSLWAWH